MTGHRRDTMILLMVNVVSQSRVPTSKIATERVLLGVSNANNFTYPLELDYIIL